MGRFQCQCAMQSLALLLLATASVQAFLPSSGTGVLRHTSAITMAAKKAAAKKAAAPAAPKGRGRNPFFSMDSGSVARKSGASLADLKAEKDKVPIPGIGAGKTQETSVALSFLDYPSNLDGTMIGDVGFDPLGFA